MKQILQLNSPSDFQTAILAPIPTIFFFSTSQCGVCHAMLPKLASALESYPNPIIDVDASRFPDIAGQHRIFVAPTVLVFYEGKEILRESRFIDIDKILRLLDLIQSS